MIPSAPFNLPPGCRSRDTEPGNAGYCRECDVELIAADHSVYRCNISNFDGSLCDRCAETASQTFDGEASF